MVIITIKEFNWNG